MSYRTFAQIVAEAESLGRSRLAVAAADDERVLQAVKMATDAGLVTPVLVGGAGRIREIGEAVGLSFAGVEVVDAADPEEAALAAVRVVAGGGADILLKGMVNSSIFMKAVLRPEGGLRQSGILSGTSIFQIPGWDRLIVNGDAGVNVAPTLAEKWEILKNGIAFMHALGWRTPKAAIITANERVNLKMPATLDAAILVRMAGEIEDAVVDGPMALDLAVSKDSARRKGYASPVAGEADFLLWPSIEAGNVFGKSVVYFAGAKIAGFVLGAKVPIIMASRDSSPEEDFNSIATASLLAMRRR